MKNTTLLGVIVAIVLIIGGFMLVNGKTVTRNVVAQDADVIAGESQQVVLSMKNFNYYPQEVRVKAGQPVEVKLDSKVGGCLRSIVFDLGDKKASKYLRTDKDSLIFTPTKKGTFNFACSMGMGYGTLVVD